VLPSLLKLISRLDMLHGTTGMERRANREQSEVKNENTALGIFFSMGGPVRLQGGN